MAERLEINYNSLHDYQKVASAYAEVDMCMSTLSFYHHQIITPYKERDTTLLIREGMENPLTAPKKRLIFDSIACLIVK